MVPVPAPNFPPRGLWFTLEDLHQAGITPCECDSTTVQIAEAWRNNLA